MKVICIDSMDNELGGSGHDRFSLKEGCIYNVNQECIGQYSCGKRIEAYELCEDVGVAYEKFRFIQLSQIDETELINTKEYVLRR